MFDNKVFMWINDSFSIAVFLIAQISETAAESDRFA